MDLNPGYITGLKLTFFKWLKQKMKCTIRSYQVVIAQWLARRLATGEVLGSNPGKSENLLISDLKGNLIIQI